MTIIPENLEIHKPKEILANKIKKARIKEKYLLKIESDFHSISVVQNKFGRFLKYLDTYQAGVINSKIYQGNIPYINYFLIPILMKKSIKDVLFIGFGSGIIINQYEKLLDNIKRIDIVDIEENIFPIAQKYFDFKISDNMNFYLQDALVYLKETRKKYDLIIVDVAGNDGIDERFCSIEYLNLIKTRLKHNGIFVSNMPSSMDIFNKKNKFVLELLKNYKKVFKNIDIYNGLTSDKIYYKVFYDIDECVFDITNLILISSDKKYEINKNYSIFEKIKLNIEPYLDDYIKSL